MHREFRRKGITVYSGIATVPRSATITIDAIAAEFFPQPEAEIRGILDILEELQKRLRDKGSDPRYQKIIFAVEGQNMYLEMALPRITAERHRYGLNHDLLQKNLSLNTRDTLVVANNEQIAEIWEKELRFLHYSVRRI